MPITPYPDSFTVPSGLDFKLGFGTPRGLSPSITGQPSNQSAVSGGTATFSVSASGTAPFTYQWKKGGVNVSGAVSSSYTTPALLIGDNGSSYTVDVTNAYGTVSSSAAILTVTAVASATAFSLVFSSAGTNDVPVTVTVTPVGGPLSGAATVTLAASNGGVLGTTTLSFSNGATAAQTTTLTRSADGTSVVTMSNTLGLTNTGSGASFTSSAAVVLQGIPAPLRLKSSVTGVVPFTAGYTFKQGDIPSGSGIAITGATAQATVKNRWSDDSVKFAIISGTYSSTAGVQASVVVEAGTAITGTALDTTNLPSGIRTTGISITAGAFGSVSWTDTDFDSPFETWVSGPRMSSWLYRKQIGSDAHLVAWLEIKLFITGEVEVLPWIENGYTLVAVPTSKNATYTFSLGGSQRFSQAVDLPSHCRIVLLSGAAQAHWLGTDPDVIVRHDTDYMQASGLVPVYMAKTPDNAAAIAGLPVTYSPMTNGSFPVAGLGGVGGNNYVGLFPEWDALYLTNGNDTTYRAVSINGYAVGRYAFHYREDPTFATVADRYKPVRLANHTTLTIMGESPGWETTPNVSGTAAPAWSGDHQPNTGYLAYLVTGRKYHLDTVNFCAGGNVLGSPWPWREQGLGIFNSAQAGGNRQMAWMWRMMVQAAAINPDGSVYQADFRTQLTNNVVWYHNKYIVQSHNQFGFTQPYGGYHLNLNGSIASGATTTSIPVNQPGLGYNGVAPDDQYNGFGVSINGESSVCVDYISATNTLIISPALTSAPSPGTSILVSDGRYWDAPWMQDYITAVWGWTQELGCGLDSTNNTKMNALISWKAQSIIGRLGKAGVGSYNYRDFGPYELPIAPSQAIDWDSGTGPWFASWTALYAALYSGQASDGGQPAPYGSNGPDVDGPIRSSGIINGNPESSQLAALAAIAYAVRRGVSGAEAAYQRLQSSGNWYQIIAMLDTNPLWGIGPYVTPQWQRGQAIGEWREIPNTSMYNDYPGPAHTARTTAGGTSAGSPWMDAYTGMGTDRLRGQILQVANGGHGDYYGNEIVKINLLEDRPAWREWFWGSEGNVVATPAVDGDAYYNDDGISGRLPPSAHSYYSTQPVARHNRMLRIGDVSISPTGSGWVNTESFSLVTAQGVNGWGAQYEYKAHHIASYSGVYSGGTVGIAQAVCSDPRTDKIYSMGSAGDFVFTPSISGPNGSADSGGSWSPMVGTSGMSNNGPASAVDTRRGRILAVYGSTADYFVYDIDGGTGWGAKPRGTFTGSGVADLVAAGIGTSLGLTYDPTIDAWLIRMGPGGSKVLKIDASLPVGSMTCELLSVTGGSSIPPTAMKQAGGTVVPGNYEGVYNRWEFVYPLRGPIFAVRNSANLWHLRTK